MNDTTILNNNGPERPKSAIKSRICYALEDPLSNICDLISPCKCKGSMKYVHRSCLKVWRYKSKRFAEMKRCEYCLSNYTIEDEILPHKTLTRTISLFIFFTFFILFHYILNILMEIFCVLKGGVPFLSENIFYKINLLPEKNDFTVKQNDIFFIQLTLSGSLVVVSLIYQLFKTRNLFHSFNYMFTLWRVLYFNFYIDSLYFLVLNVLQVYSLIIDFCFVMDYLVYFTVNL
ncbi:hypothetical protein TUBRATIS_23450 [Tubulinosema ratisbonensis]|uniref:RING-CH-type domain-containing protein n=1 Tax=Tubulinosema ratisbonensis TaxID=291195 RepID=A0A437AJ72_9MICR|nr:hypothetical protein TUBRATIS_23450 [Tubulinosema ratisbonensis]